MKVGFVLENGFNSDDGALKTTNKLFDREANLFVTSDFGTLSAGRVGILNLKTVESTLSQIRRRRARGTSGLWPSSP